MPENQRPPSPGDLNALALAGAAMAPEKAVAVLCGGEVEILGRMPWSSNATFLVTCRLGDAALPAVYKPADGERPLWDFEPGIYRREVAAYVLSELMGIGLVPETVTRFDAPMGVGSLQRFVPADFAEHYFTILTDPASHDRLRALATIDIVANNADRKGGHVLLDAGSSIWAIDNGLCFHEEHKLRTVVWDFAGDPVPYDLLPVLCWLAEVELPGSDGDRIEPPTTLHARPEPSDRPTAATGPTGSGGSAGPLDLDRCQTGWNMLADLLRHEELVALRRRARRLVTRRRLPHPDPNRHHYPWPLV